MSNQNVARPPTQQQKGPSPRQGAPQTQPPVWDVFQGVDASKQSQIYNTMCDQIASQQKQIIGLVDKIKTLDPQNSARPGAPSGIEQKLLEENKKLRQELEQSKKQDMQGSSGISGSQNEKQIQMMVMNFMKEKELLVKKMKDEKDQSDGRIMELENKLAMVEMQGNGGGMEHSSDQQKVERLEREKHDLSNQLQMLRNKLDDSERQYNQARNEINNLQAQIKQMSQDMGEKQRLESQCRVQAQEIQNMHDENQRLKAQREKMEVLNSQITSILKQKELENLNEDRKNLQNMYNQIQDKMSKLKEMETLETQFQDIFSDFKSIKSQYGVQTQKIKDYETVIEDLIAENSRLVLDLCNQKF